MPPDETLGERIRRVRTERGLSLAKVSGAVFSRAFLNQIEFGRSQPSTRVLRVIADRLGTEVDYLLEGRLPGVERELALEKGRVLLARGNARRALGLVGEPKMRLDRIRAKGESLAVFQRPKALQAVIVAMSLENLLLAPQDLPRLSFAPEHRQGFRLTEPGVASQRPLGRIDCRTQGRQSPPCISARKKHAGFLDRQLPLDAGQATFQQVVDLCAQPPGDDPEHSGRGLAAAELDLIQERTAEVRATDSGKAEPALLAHTADSLPERFVPRHCKALLYR